MQVRIITRIAIAVGVLALAAGVAGCGDEEDEARVTTPIESAEPLPDLPKDWSVHRNQDAGFAIGMPPEWKAKDTGIATELRSPEGLAAVSVAADRTSQVMEAPIEEVATSTIAGPIPRLRNVEPGDPRPFEHRYDAVALRATGISAKEDFRQRLLLVILRREDIVTFTVLAAHNAEEHRRFYEGEIERMIRSIRSRPIGPPAQSAQGEPPSGD